MFKRENRLAAGVRFNNSYSFSTSQFVLKIRKNGLALNRFGIIVSKKIDKRAVGRNKIKRAFREALISLMKNMVFGYDMLFIAKPGILNKTKEEIERLAEESLRKAGVTEMRDEG